MKDSESLIIIDDKIIINEIISFMFNSNATVNESDKFAVLKFKDGYPETLYSTQMLNDVHAFGLNLSKILKKKFINNIINSIILKYKVPNKSLHISSKIFKINEEF